MHPYTCLPAGKTLTVISLIATNRPGVNISALQPYAGSLVSGAAMLEDLSHNGPPAKRRKVCAGGGRGLFVYVYMCLYVYLCVVCVFG